MVQLSASVRVNGRSGDCYEPVVGPLTAECAGLGTCDMLPPGPSVGPVTDWPASSECRRRCLSGDKKKLAGAPCQHLPATMALIGPVPTEGAFGAEGGWGKQRVYEAGVVVRANARCQHASYSRFSLQPPLADCQMFTSFPHDTLGLLAHCSMKRRNVLGRKFV
ncbi:hypothetical protein E2C01_038687 [Portunus trituberculatus]|uniref:Uncharacterized protein n=1 Tax=Portunus trituberculatus TaxID=210409 RepID=A0A5B7FKR1_PORTR|nr:hypothetical protein [Portunus trituberculatus]